MRYRSQTDRCARLPVKGDVCLFREAGETGFVRFHGAVVSVIGDTLTIRRLCHTDPHGSRHLISDLAPTGLEYSAYIDSGTAKVRMNDLVRVLGRLSRNDRVHL